MKKTLSNREKQVLKLLLAEYRIVDIARLLDLSQSRVQDVKQIIFKKWEVESMVGLTKKAIKCGILELDEDNFSTTQNVQSNYVYTIK